MAIRTLAQVASVLKTQAQIGLRPGRNWPKAYRTGNLFNSVKSTIKSTSDALSYTLSLSSLFYGAYIVKGGNSRGKYKAGPRPYTSAAVNSKEFGIAVQEYTKYQIDLKFQKAFKKSQKEFGK
jgi:hypothetical protein